MLAQCTNSFTYLTPTQKIIYSTSIIVGLELIILGLVSIGSQVDWNSFLARITKPETIAGIAAVISGYVQICVTMTNAKLARG